MSANKNNTIIIKVNGNLNLLPDEILLKILTLLEPEDLVKCLAVCKKWGRILRSCLIWSIISKKKIRTNILPWYCNYAYFKRSYFTNMISNGNGQNGFNSWEIIANGGNKFAIENSPIGSDPLPKDVAEFKKCTSCFVTSYGECTKRQTIVVKDDRILSKILNTLKPHIYVSEWIAGRWDCGSTYKLTVTLKGDNGLVTLEKSLTHEEKQWVGKAWSKNEIKITSYPVPVHKIILEHSGQDTQFWRGHYGMKMAGAVIKLEFDTIKRG